MNKENGMNSHENYTACFSEENFWGKARNFVSAIGTTLLREALTLYHVWRDPETPAWAKTSIIGALGYFISPIDAIPDVIPLVGYTDDAAVVAGVLTLVTAYLKEEHREYAREKVEEWFG